MRYVLVGLSHRTAPVEYRERVVFGRDEIVPATATLARDPRIQECLLLSTCNRTEVAAVSAGDGQHAAAIDGIREFIRRERALTGEDLDRYLYAHQGVEVVRHIFRVASSLDSMVLGEPQILGQIKEAYDAAQAAKTLGRELDPLLQRAFSVAKRVRTDTGISRNPVSIAQAATELAGRIFGTLEGRSILILGTGKMAELAAKHLLSGGGVANVYVTSRTFQRAQDCAARVGGSPVTFDRLHEYLPRVDIVISSTAAPHHILRREDGPVLMRNRKGRPIFFIDIAVPRDIDPALNEIDNVYLYDIDDLQQAAEEGMEERRREADRAEAIVAEEVSRFVARVKVRGATPIIVAMREKLHGIAGAEIDRHRGRLGPLSDNQEEAIRQMMSALVQKILHGPIRQVKKSTGSGAEGATLNLVRQMFDLDVDFEAGEEAPGGRRERTRR